MSRARTCFASAALIAAPIALAQPLQTDYDATIYCLVSTGDIVTGSLAHGISEVAATTAIGGPPGINSGLEFTPDGRLLAAGGPTLWELGIWEINPADGSHTPLVTVQSFAPHLDSLYQIKGIVAAPDGTIYTIAEQFATLPDGSLTFVYDVVHFDARGDYLHHARIHHADGSDAYWSSHASTLRDDGKIVSALWTSTGSLSPDGNIGVIDPETGLLEIINDYYPYARQFKGFTTIGSTLFASLGPWGDQIYTVDPYTGDLAFVVELADLPGFGSGIGFAVMPDPCAADLTYDGLLNVDDIAAFVDAFLSGSTAADLNFSRTQSVDDVNVFIESFLAGCDD